jgi:hypothetical protein
LREKKIQSLKILQHLESKQHPNHPNHPESNTHHQTLPQLGLKRSWWQQAGAVTRNDENLLVGLNEQLPIQIDQE